MTVKQAKGPTLCSLSLVHQFCNRFCTGVRCWTLFWKMKGHFPRCQILKHQQSHSLECTFDDYDEVRFQCAPFTPVNLVSQSWKSAARVVLPKLSISAYISLYRRDTPLLLLLFRVFSHGILETKVERDAKRLGTHRNGELPSLIFPKLIILTGIWMFILSHNSYSSYSRIAYV